MCANCGHDECEGCVMGAAFPPPADRPVAGWLTIGYDPAGFASLRPGAWYDEAVAQRAEVARLTEERDSYRRGWNRAEDCQTRLRSQRDEAVRTATSALALAREYDREVGCGCKQCVARRAKLDALTP